MADAHLVGSVNLDTAEQVFRTVSEIAGDSVTRLPDGETGPRSGWIFHLIPRLAANPSLEPGPSVPHPPTRSDRYIGDMPAFKLRDGVDPDDVVFDLGFSTTAAASYTDFRRLKQDGVIRPDVKFQVGIPTQVAVLGALISLEDQPRLIDVYERQLAREVAKIVDTVPRDELALQWEVAVEIGIIEGALESVHDTTGLLDQLGRLVAMVPDDVTLGFHLCYGDAPTELSGGVGRHIVEPKDTANLVMVACGILDRVRRPVGFIHLPVPIDRDDDAYFEPLADLRLPGTKLYLGLVHHQDGLDGTQRRADVAARHVSGFGVATECGMGRRPREVVPDLLRIQRDVTVEG